MYRYQRRSVFRKRVWCSTHSQSLLVHCTRLQAQVCDQFETTTGKQAMIQCCGTQPGSNGPMQSFQVRANVAACTEMSACWF